MGGPGQAGAATSVAGARQELLLSTQERRDLKFWLEEAMSARVPLHAGVQGLFPQETELFPRQHPARLRVLTTVTTAICP